MFQLTERRIFILCMYMRYGQSDWQPPADRAELLHDYMFDICYKIKFAFVVKFQDLKLNLPYSHSEYTLQNMLLISFDMFVCLCWFFGGGGDLPTR